MNELYHYGVLGMKWGRRKSPDTTALSIKSGKRNQKSERSTKRKKIINNAFEENIKGGKDKPNISRAEKMARDTGRIIDDGKNALSSIDRIHQRRKNRTNDKKTEPVDLSKMSDEELRQKVNRLNLEKQYSTLSGSQEVANGSSYANDILGTAGAIVSITGSAIAIASSIKKLRE